uniref:RNase H type-1 domain-containing protein n=1 Tax=Arundo donax TaxID=35708 RepID=A0A0A9G1M6_ARUDO
MHTSFVGEFIVGFPYRRVKIPVHTQDHCPPEARLKLNIDANFIRSTEMASAGFILRNHAGSILLSGSLSLPTCSDAEEAEATACLQSLRNSLSCLHFPTLVELDCAEVVASLNRGDKLLSRLHFIYVEIKKLMLSDTNIVFCKTERGCNLVAHELAQLARKSCTGIWHYTAPESLLHFVHVDYVNSNAVIL